MFLNDIFDENDFPFDRKVTEAPVVSKKENILNKGVEKMLAAITAWQNARDEAVKYLDDIPPKPKLDVAVVVKDHPNSLSYGTIKFIGRSGLVHVKLNGGKLENWASGDEIAVRPNEIFATWDPALQNKTTVHREYNPDGSKAVREGPEEHFAKDPSGYTRNMHTGRLEGPHWSAVGDKPTGRYAKRLERYAKERAEREAKPEPVAEATGLKKRVKIVKGPAAGKTGYVGEVHHGLFKGAPKQFVIDLDGGGNVKCSKDELRLVKE